MFGRNKDEMRDQPQPHKPRETKKEAVVSQPQSLPKGSSTSINSVVGKEARFQGNVKVTGAIRVDGEVEGDIEATERVQIGQDGVVKGEIRAQEISVTGKVNGKLSAIDLVHLMPGAKVEGAVATPRFVIEDGAMFDGSCEMERRRHSESQDSKNGKDRQKLEVVKPHQRA